MTEAEARDSLQRSTRAVLDAITAWKDAIDAAAEAEGFYRASLAGAYRESREGGATVGEAETYARGKCAPQAVERDQAAGRLRLAEAKYNAAMGSRESVFALIRLGVAAAEQMKLPENTPSDRWP